MKFSRRTAQVFLAATICILVLGMTVVFVGSTEGRAQPTPDGFASAVSHAGAQH